MRILRRYLYFKGFLSYPNYNNFPFFVNKLDIKNIINELELNKKYYYDDYILKAIFRCLIEMIFMKYLIKTYYLFYRFIKKV